MPRRKGHAPSASPSRAEVAEIKTLLAGFGVAWETEGKIDIAVQSDKDRRRHMRDIVSYHVVSYAVPNASYLVIGELSSGSRVLVPDAALCFLQYASVASFCELVEFGYELCGAYELSLDVNAKYRERTAPRTVASLTRYIESVSKVRNASLALRALRYVRDGSASPMETALAMMVTLPRKLGGLGIRDVALNERVALSGKARRLAKRKSFVLDLYISRARIDVEYNGALHDDPEQRERDHERSNALGTMGYVVYTATASTFAAQLTTTRFLQGIAQRAHVRSNLLDSDFQNKQNALRLFVTRSWLHKDA